MMLHREEVVYLNRRHHQALDDYAAYRHPLVQLPFWHWCWCLLNRNTLVRMSSDTSITTGVMEVSWCEPIVYAYLPTLSTMMSCTGDQLPSNCMQIVLAVTCCWLSGMITLFSTGSTCRSEDWKGLKRWESPEAASTQ